MVSKTVKNSLIASAAGASALAAGALSASADTVSVKDGDTIWGFSQKYNISVDELAAVNALSDANLIVKGQTINIPEAGQSVAEFSAPATTVASNVSTANNDGSVTVAAGDSLYGIASRNNMTVDQIKAINGLVSDLIYPGQVLSLVASAEVSAPAATTEVNAPAADATATAVNYDLASAAPVETAQDATVSAAAQAPSTPAATSGDWNSVAHSLVGIPYVWGGSTTAGFDCSGFVQYVRANSGQTNLGRTTTQQAASLRAAGSYPISVDQAQPGDLIFWGAEGAEYHVAIYLGGGRVIAATQPGDIVREDVATWGNPVAYHNI